MINPSISNFYNNRLNFAERIYAAQKSYNGAASAAKVRAEVPSTGAARVAQSVRLGAAHGYNTGNTLANKINSPLLRNTTVSAALGATAHAVPQLPSGIILPYVGNIAALGGSLGLTALVGTGASYNPVTDKSSYSWVLKALAHYGMVGFVTEQPLAALSRSENDYVANTAGVLACAARFVLEVPRAVLTGVAAALFTGIPSVAGGTLGGVANFLHSLVSSKPAQGLVASGSPAAVRVTSATGASTHTEPLMGESITGNQFAEPNPV